MTRPALVAEPVDPRRVRDLPRRAAGRSTGRPRLPAYVRRTAVRTAAAWTGRGRWPAVRDGRHAGRGQSASRARRCGRGSSAADRPEVGPAPRDVTLDVVIDDGGHSGPRPADRAAVLLATAPTRWPSRWCCTAQPDHPALPRGPLDRAARLPALRAGGADRRRRRPDPARRAARPGVARAGALRPAGLRRRSPRPGRGSSWTAPRSRCRAGERSAERGRALRGPAARRLPARPERAAAGARGPSPDPAYARRRGRRAPSSGVRPRSTSRQEPPGVRGLHLGDLLRACPRRRPCRRPSRPPGPCRSTQSAVLMTSRLCSMTITVLPWSTSRPSTPSSLRMSSKCRPVVGSSST